MLSSPSPSSSSQLSQLGASLYAPQSRSFYFHNHIAAASDVIWYNFGINVPRLSAGALGFSVRGMGNNTPQLNRNLTQGTQLPSHITPTTGVPTMSLHTPPSPSRYLPLISVFMSTFSHDYPSCLNRGTLPMNSRNMLNHSQVGQGIGMSGRTNSMGSSGLGSPNRSSPSIICMPKQQPARQPFTINR